MLTAPISYTSIIVSRRSYAVRGNFSAVSKTKSLMYMYMKQENNTLTNDTDIIAVLVSNERISSKMPVCRIYVHDLKEHFKIESVYMPNVSR